MQNLRIGTCSWKYPSWHGLVYSRPDGIDYLEEYARQYDTVEIDQWFWSLFSGGKIRLPDSREAESYRNAVPSNFRFTVKAPNSITLTHSYSREKKKPGSPNPHFLSAKLASAFLDSISPLHDVLGPVILQFEYLNREKMASQEAFEKSLRTFRPFLPGGFEFGIEIRNPNYLNDRLFGFLQDNEFLPVLLEGYWMPPVAVVHEKHGERLKKFKVLVLRLHGKDRESIEGETGKEWNRIVRPADAELTRLAGVISDWLDSGLQVYVNVNNHFEGSAPLTIRRLLERLPK